jgi:hypothetical protein
MILMRGFGRAPTLRSRAFRIASRTAHGSALRIGRVGAPWDFFLLALAHGASMAGQWGTKALPHLHSLLIDDRCVPGVCILISYPFGEIAA